MGNWAIIIRGTGIHHNKKTPKDANQMAMRFADELKAAGHSIASASFTYGGEEDLFEPTAGTRSGYYDKD